MVEEVHGECGSISIHCPLHVCTCTCSQSHLTDTHVLFAIISLLLIVYSIQKVPMRKCQKKYLKQLSKKQGLEVNYSSALFSTFFFLMKCDYIECMLVTSGVMMTSTKKKTFCSHYNQQQIISELLWAIGKDPGMTSPFWSVFQGSLF